MTAHTPPIAASPPCPASCARTREPSPGVVLALRREDAAKALGVSDEGFDRYVRPSLPVVRLGALRVYPVAALEQWLIERADSPIGELERVA
jgi:hypothetical protein